MSISCKSRHINKIDIWHECCNIDRYEKINGDDKMNDKNDRFNLTDDQEIIDTKTGQLFNTIKEFVEYINNQK